MAQLGFFDADKRLEALSAKGDPLEAIDRLVPWEVKLATRPICTGSPIVVKTMGIVAVAAFAATAAGVVNAEITTTPGRKRPEELVNPSLSDFSLSDHTTVVLELFFGKSCSRFAAFTNRKKALRVEFGDGLRIA
jgi:hypothetical protein